MNLTLVRSENFNGVICDFYQGEDDIWMTREQAGQALEYKRPKAAIDIIHLRRRDRLDLFSTTFKLKVVEGGRLVEREVVMYSSKGIYEICRWSRQPKANEFMDFVWNIVDALRRGQLVPVGQQSLAFPQLAEAAQEFRDLAASARQCLVELQACMRELHGGLPKLLPQPKNQAEQPNPKRGVCRVHSKILDLPHDVRAKVDAMLNNNCYTYTQIADFLRRSGVDVSRSAVGRYAQRNTKFKRN